VHYKLQKLGGFNRRLAAVIALLAATSVSFGSLDASAQQARLQTLMPSALKSVGSSGCSSVNNGAIDLQAETAISGGTTSASVSKFQSGEWLTVNVSGSVAVVTFLEVFDTSTTLTLESKLVAEIDPLQGNSSASVTYPVSKLGSQASLNVTAGYEGVGSFKITVRCTTYDPRKATS
jgi:hypothetical protein